MQPYRDDDDLDDDVVDTSTPTATPISSVAAGTPMHGLELHNTPPPRPVSVQLCLFLLGGLAGIFFVYSTIQLPVGSAGSNSLFLGGGVRGNYGDALSFSLFGGANSVTPSASNGPPTASQTASPTTTQSFGGTASGTPSNSGTPTGSPTGTPTSSGTPTGTTTASGTGTADPTPSGTGTASKTPSSSNTGSPTQTLSSFTVMDCVKASTAWLESKRKGIGGVLTSTIPFTHDMLHDAVYRACPYEIAVKTYWMHHYTIDDICYVVRDLQDNAGERAAVTATWASQVPARNLWIFSAQADAAHRTVQLTSLEGKNYLRRHVATLVAAAHMPNTEHCKWWVAATTHTWQNPRVHLASVQGLPTAWPVHMGFFWDQMGFVDGITTPAGGNAIWSSSAWQKIQVSIATNTCDRDSQKSDDVLVGLCALNAGVLPVNINNYESSGALLLNGVPLEPGPQGHIMAWLQQPQNRAGHWGSIEGMNEGFVTSIYNDYAKVYGPLGRLLPGSPVPDGVAASPSAAPAGEPTGAPLPAGAAPCAVRATKALRTLLGTGRTGPFTGIPLPMDVAAEVTARECNPLTAPGANDPAAIAGAPHAIDHNVCVAITYSGKPDIVKFLARGGWGWRMKHKPGDSHRRLWIFGATEIPVLYVETLPGLDKLDDAHKLLTIVKAMSTMPGTEHCLWWYLGGSDIDWVNARALALMVRGLHHETPLAVGLWLHGLGEVDVPATGRIFMSSGALALVAPKLQTSACPAGATEDYYTLARCMWDTGVVPVHSYAMDVAGMGIGMDWAFQQEP